MGPGGAPPDPPNSWPTITVAPERASVAVGDAVTLTARASDDGIPKPRRNRSNEAPRGVTIRWIEYRGPGQVAFSAPTATGAHGVPTSSTTTATFTAPGTYVLRAIASDGLLESPRSVTVTVE
jgi:plastocyanin